MSDTKALIKYVRERLEYEPNLTFGKPTVRELVDALEAATTEPPTVDGWYFRKEKDGRTHIFPFTGNWDDYECMNISGNLWAGPIPAPIEP